MEAGANVNLLNKYSNTALYVAATNNCGAIIDLLLAYKADVMRKNYVIVIVYILIGK